MFFLVQGFMVSADGVLKTVSGIFLAALAAGAIYIARKWPLLEKAFTHDFPASLAEIDGKLAEIDGKVDTLTQQMTERRVRGEDIERRLLKVETRLDGLVDRGGVKATS